MVVSVLKAIRKCGDAFLRDRRGNFAIFTALAAFPVMFTVGGAVDLNMYYTHRVKIQNASDAAALAAARRFVVDPDDARLQQFAQDYFDANIGSLYRAETALDYQGTKINESGVRELTIDVEFSYDPVFLPLMAGQFAGLDGKSHVKSVIAIGNTTVEMAMVLDTSGSMNDVPKGGGGAKIAALRTIASDAIDQLFNASEMAGVEDPVRISVVPFSGAVNLGVDMNSWWLDPKGLHPRHHVNLDWAKYNYTTLPADYRESTVPTDPWNQQRYSANQIAVRDPRSSLPSDRRPWVRKDDTNVFLTRQYVMQNMRGSSAPMLESVSAANAGGCKPPRGRTLPLATVCEWQRDGNGWVYVERTLLSGSRDICRQGGTGPLMDPTCHPPYVLQTSGQPFFKTLLDQKRVCAEARTGIYGISGEPPSEAKPETLFLPFFAPDEYDLRGAVSLGNPYLWDQGYANSGSSAANKGWNHLLATGPALNPVNNAITNPLYNVGPGSTATAAQKNEASLASQRDVRRYLMGPMRTTSTVGANNLGSPFYLCDSDPLVPLSNKRDAAKSAVSRLNATGATNVEEGLGWGWRAITPEEPFAGARARGDENNFKAIVVMTDGANTYYPNVNGTLNRSSYGAYGFLSEGRIYENTTYNPAQTSSIDLTRAMNQRTAKLCENVKNDGRVPVKTARGEQVMNGSNQPVSRDGVLIYTIAFDVQDAEVHKLLQDCASATIADQMAGRPLAQSQKYFYSATNNAQLAAAFNDIIASLTALRIAR